LFPHLNFIVFTIAPNEEFALNIYPLKKFSKNSVTSWVDEKKSNTEIENLAI
jgi:hypothetical protein